ncbi:MAG: hypothetical protein A3J55_00090 [Candidatus Ryanbacteria bacterium RIFCSPHIGHO2_02_FULL_45_17b]|nr:MAG: hypothetical protein A3J55_00090 [Candidatus Ryanbacteria bacterium RIFCSPHIGHO2_02_FULL_45_17b]
MRNSKSAIVGVIAILAIIPFWFFFYDAITGAVEALASTYAIISLSIHLIAVNILFLFAARPRFVFLPYALGIAPIFYFFGILLVTIVAYVLLLIAVVIGYHRVKRELKNRITFHVPILLRQGLPTLLTAFSIACAIGYYVETTHAPKRITIRDILPQSMFTAIFKNTVPLLPDTILPSFDQNDTVDRYTEKQLQASGIDLQQVSQEERVRVLKETRVQLFSHRELTGTEKLSDVFYDITIARSEKFFDSYQQFVPLALALGFFLFLRTVALPYGWIIILIMSGIVAIMKKNNMLHYVEEHVVKERLELV